MPLPSPNLDDRGFRELLKDAIHRLDQSCPTWTDRSPSDPGMVLLELFTHLTEVMNFRLNRVPEKAYIEFLRLLGVSLHPPVAASVNLTFSLSRSQATDFEIPKGTKVTLTRASGDQEPPIFTTRSVSKIKAGETNVEISAFHCEQVNAELIGEGTGFPGLNLKCKKSPLIASIDNDDDFFLAVEAEPFELDERIPAIKWKDRACIIWKEVENFSNLDNQESRVYMLDRISGAITFAPSVSDFQADDSNNEDNTPKVLAAVPARGKQILIWYAVGGGVEGNVGENTLNILKTPLAGIKVNNSKRAFGGKDAESLKNALIRGPLEFNTLQRVVTAKDFERLAVSRSGAIARAKAFTTKDLWAHAAPGSATVLLVPDIPTDLRVKGKIQIVDLKKQESTIDIQSVSEVLNQRRAIGTQCSVSWASYKEVQVQARVIVHREEDPVAVKRRVLSRIYHSISPVPTEGKSSAWEFGRALRASHVYDIILAEPGVSYVDRVKLVVNNVPDQNIRMIDADAFQPNTWYATTKEKSLYRSLDNGNGWERVGYFPNENVNLVCSHSRRAGMVAVANREDVDKKKWHVHISLDCGENWQAIANIPFRIRDMTWILRGTTVFLLLATDLGLYELTIGGKKPSVPVQILVDNAQQNLGFYAVEMVRSNLGVDGVVLAGREGKGVYYSSDCGKPNSFKNIGLVDEDVRILSVQYDGPRIFLWAGLAAPSPSSKGQGCCRSEITLGVNTKTSWDTYSDNWEGGSCYDIAFQGSIIYAATFRSGVLSLDASKRNENWAVPSIESNLPLRDRGRFHPVRSIAAGKNANTIMAGGKKGIFFDENNQRKFSSCSNQEFLDTVTLPPTWLFCSGEHEILVEIDA